MANAIMFDTTASRPKHALALIYDLEGFSRFFNQPDVQDYVPQFLNTVNRALSINLYGGTEFWGKKETIPALPLEPKHNKFLGDGALYVWIEKPKQKITNHLVANLCNRLWNIQDDFDAIVKTSHQSVPVIDLPKKIRFGIARGTVYELRRKGSRSLET